MKTKVTKNQTASVGKYSYQYVDIAQIHEYLEANNMSYYQYIDRIDGDDYIMTVKIINGDKKPAEVVKSRFCKLNGEHIRFVLDSMSENTSRVRNIRKYLLSVLYNASMTIDSYYCALVNHDLYGG